MALFPEFSLLFFQILFLLLHKLIWGSAYLSVLKKQTIQVMPQQNNGFARGTRSSPSVFLSVT